MASKKGKSVVNVSLLASIASGDVAFISQADGLPLLEHVPPLISVDTAKQDSKGNAAVWLTDAGKSLVPSSNAARHALTSSETPIYSVVSGIDLPPREVKRRGRFGGAGAPTIYPWATMDVGGWFFVPVSEKHSDPSKSMTSAVSSANMKYSEEVGEPKEHTRTKRGPGNKAVVGADGKPERETIMRRDREPVKKFELYGNVKSGVRYGNWEAPTDGVIVRRVI